jgi:hypothetical protein
MARSTTPVVLAGSVTMLSDYMQGKGIEWKVALATGIGAGILALVEQADAQVAVGIGWIAFFATLVMKHPNGAPSPVTVFLKEWDT